VTWVWAFPYLIPLPLPGAKVELLLKKGEEVREAMGKSVDKELLRERRIFQ